MRTETKGTVAVLAAAAGYSTLPVLVKLALAAGARIWPLVAWRFLVAAVVVWAYVGLTGRRLPPQRSVWALLALGAVYSGDAIAFLVGLQWVPAATASLIFFTYPALVVVLAALVLGQRLSVPRMVAVILTVAGCALTAGAGLHGGEPRGIVLILLGVLLIALFVVAGDPVMRDLPAHGASAVVLTGTAMVALLAAGLTGGMDLGGGREAALLTALVGLLATALPVTLFLAGIKGIGAGRAAIYSTVEPALTVLLAAWLLAERLTWGQLLGGALILAGVLWLRVERPARPRPESVQLESP